LSLSNSTTPLFVLDSNVVLDWLVFRDPSCRGLDHFIAAGHAGWIATQAMRDELEHVLTRGEFVARQPDASVVWSAWTRWVRVVEAPSAPPIWHPRCTDPDDQKFIDLALQVGATTLLSRDRAVLKLARRARALGLAIQTPDAWAQSLLFEFPPEFAK
jgi:predicted nucleic acid-binding protein